MAFTYVGATGKQNFDGSFTTTLVTDAFALTAGNMAVAVIRVTTNAAASDVAVHDTAGNLYRLDGAFTGVSPGFAVFSCRKCLGHATNVVTVTHRSSDFTAVTVLQFSGTDPLGRALDTFTSATIASGATVSCLPAGHYLHQLAIVASDRENGGLPTFGPAATFTTVYSSGPTGNGPYIGVGSHSVAYQVNSTKYFDGSISVSSTWSDTTAGKTIVFALYSITGPIAYEDPCSIEEPRVFAKVTTETETIKVGVHPLRDSAALGGFAEPRLLDVSPISKVASDPSTGSWSAQTVTMKWADTDRDNRARSETRTSFRNCPAEIYLTSNAQRAAGGPPRVLFSGTVYSDAADENLVFTQQINDLIGSNYSLFSEEKQIPQRTVSLIYFPNAPEASIGQGEPIVCGRIAPLNPANGEGLLDTIPVGLITIGGTPGTPTSTTLATLVAALQTSKTAGTLYVDWGGTFGFADCQSLQDYSGSVPSDFDELCGGVGSFVGLGYEDVQAYLNGAATTGGTQYYAVLVAGHAITTILAGLNSDPSIWIDDTQIPGSAYGTSVWAPQIIGDTTWTSDIGSDEFVDVLGTDGTTRRYTLILFDPAGTEGLAVIAGGRVHLDCIGLEDVGDGTGAAVTDYFSLYRHCLINFILQDYQSGAWLTNPQFLFSDGVTLIDRVDEDSFDTASAVITAQTGARLGSFKIGDRTSVRDVIAQFNFSGGCLLGQDDYGRLFVKVLNTTRTDFLTNRGQLHRTLRDKVDFLPGFRVTPKPEWQTNYVVYEYAKNYYTGNYERPAGGGGAEPVRYQAGIDRDGLLKKTFQFNFLRDDASSLYVAAYYRDLFANLPRIVEYSRRGLCGLEDDILDGVPITHYGGYGQNGYTDHACWILSTTTDPRRMYRTFTALDVNGLLSIPVGDTFLTSDPIALEDLIADDDGAFLIMDA